MSHEKYYKRTIVKESLYSTALGEERSLRIFLPPGYNELASYPVIYCQDGEQFFNYGRIATTATRLILDEGIDPFIIVGVDVNLKMRTDDYAPEGKRFNRYLQFFAEEMLDFVENRYAVRTTADERILAGDSLGGTVSLHLALEHRDEFRKLLSLSGAFLTSTQQAIADESDLSWLSIYQLIGLDEQAVQTDRGTFDFLAANRSVRQLLSERKADLLYEEKPGEHLWGFWQKELEHGLRWLLAR